ncbi:restriction endonuclease [Ornithobacterium rhinotracheale]|uniref:Eco57I restriction-modification methylase domain-containing protein n=1 Tax=Ornithobacterium rhinotracheale TaxID=28251 RepID=UPI00129C3FB7|nr:N-6 DNA methylase [Ornithobacterium rhinotracheale]MRJ09333.1 restriction endonuclease [Ornithobacterium rhinotracheale]UOH77021.1 N-6 DNA methylase [Ornithobacterium rhinotracheale]
MKLRIEGGACKKKRKNRYGQYFTPKIVAEFMIDLAKITPESKILEPSSGKGIFLDILYNKGYKNITAYEIDRELGVDYNFVKHESFVSAKINEKFDLIIGNPPYIRWKNLEKELKEELANSKLWNKYFNSLCDYLYIFILKSIEILNNNGQLIFICPEYWINTTHSSSLRNYMVENGCFEKIYHFNETPIFNNVSVSFIIFKYIKTKTKLKEINVTKYYKNRVLTNNVLLELKKSQTKNTDIEKYIVPQFVKNKRWLLTNQNEMEIMNDFEKSCSTKIEIHQDLFKKSKNITFPTIGEKCNIGNGMVSGLDKAFQLNGQKLTEYEDSKTIKVVKAKNLEPFVYKDITKYIFANDIKSESDFKEKCPNFYQTLILHKEKLEQRYLYNRSINYWEWVFLRNYNLFNSENPRIFVPSKERISNKDYFRFTYVEARIFPTQDVTAIFKKESTKESLYYILSFLNNHRVFTWLKNKGIVKGNVVEFSERPISTIPFREINWNDKKEVQYHNEITSLTKKYILEKEDLILDKINDIFDKLLLIK